MTDKSGEKREEGEIVERSDGKDWIEAGERRRRNCSGSIVR